MNSMEHAALEGYEQLVLSLIAQGDQCRPLFPLLQSMTPFDVTPSAIKGSLWKTPSVGSFIKKYFSPQNSKFVDEKIEARCKIIALFLQNPSNEFEKEFASARIHKVSDIFFIWAAMNNKYELAQLPHFLFLMQLFPNMLALSIETAAVFGHKEYIERFIGLLDKSSLGLIKHVAAIACSQKKQDLLVWAVAQLKKHDLPVQGPISILEPRSLVSVAQSSGNREAHDYLVQETKENSVYVDCTAKNLNYNNFMRAITEDDTAVSSAADGEMKFFRGNVSRPASDHILEIAQKELIGSIPGLVIITADNVTKSKLYCVFESPEFCEDVKSSWLGIEGVEQQENNCISLPRANIREVIDTIFALKLSMSSLSLS